MKRFLIICTALWLAGLTNSAALGDTDSQWYNDTWIHSHTSIAPPVENAGFVIEQIQKAGVEAVQFHCTHSTALIDAMRAKSDDGKLDFKLVATINSAGVWYDSTYIKDDRYVLRINSDGTPATRWTRKHLCFNSPAVDQIIIPNQYMGITQKIQPDQVWTDESIITINICFCKHCTDMYKKIYKESPPKKLNDDNWDKWEQWVTFHRKSYERWMQKIINGIHAVKPDTLVTINHAYLIEQPELVPSWIKNLSADVHREPLEISMYSRYCDGTGVPFDVMPGLGKDTWAGVSPKSVERIYRDVSLITAHGGRWNIGEYPTNYKSLRQELKWQGDGNRPADLYIDRAVRGGDFARERKNFCKDSKSIPNIALVHSARTHYSHCITNTNKINEDDSLSTTSDGTVSRNDVGRINSRVFWPNNKPVTHDIVGAYMYLLESHDHFDFICEQQMIKNLSNYKVIVMAEQTYLEDGTVEALEKFVKNGGSVIATGSTVFSGLNKLFGVEVVSKKPVSDLAIKVGSEKLTLKKAWKVSPVKGKSTLDFQNSDHPFIVYNKYGKGNVAYIAGDIFGQYHGMSGYSRTRRKHSEDVSEILGKVIDKVLPSPDIKITAPKWFETTLREKDGNVYLHIINRATDWKHKRAAAENIAAEIPISFTPTTVSLLPGGDPVEYKFKNGKVLINMSCDKIKYHKAIEIKR